MISLLPTIVLLFAAFISGIASGCSFLTSLLSIFSVIAAIVTASILIGCYTEIISAKHKITEAKRNIKVALAKFDAVKAIVAENLQKYPMEQEMFKEITQGKLLMLPEIKSNVFLSEQIAKLVGCREEVFKLVEEINKLRRSIAEDRESVERYIYFIPLSVFEGVMSDTDYAEVLKEAGISETQGSEKQAGS